MALMVVPVSADAASFWAEAKRDADGNIVCMYGYKGDDIDQGPVSCNDKRIGNGERAVKLLLDQEESIKDTSPVLVDTDLGAIKDPVSKDQNEAIEKLRQELIVIIMDLLRQIEDLKKQNII